MSVTVISDSQIKISKQTQKQARAIYMFIYHFSTVEYSANMVLDIGTAKTFDVNANDAFYDKIIGGYREKYEKIHKELTDYTNRVSQKDFDALRSI